MARRRRRQPRGRGRPVRQGNIIGAFNLWWRRIALVFMILAAGSLFAIDRIDSPVTREIRAGVVDVFAPVIEAMSAPFRAAADWFASFESNATVRRRNAELQKEMERLRIDLQETAALEDENRRLRKIANAGKRIQGKHITATVVADPGGPYVRSLLVRAGTEDGVWRGMAVINADGFIGRIVETGRHASRVLLVTDLNSRLPVQLAASGQRALLSGAGGRRMHLNYVPPNVSVSVGALIVTSGHGGVLPRGISVGRVDSVGRDGILVRPLVDWNRLTFVRIIDFDALGLVEEKPGSAKIRRNGSRAERR